jgi:hypothetical protein
MIEATRTLNPLHLEDLEPHRFEDLVRQLLYDFRRWRRLEATGRSGGDDGFDARAWEIVGTDSEEAASTDDSEDDDDDVAARPAPADDRQWLIQCKRERRIGPTQIEKYLNDIPAEEVRNVHGIVFAAACDFSKKARDAFRAACLTRGISEWHLWGKGEIEDRLFQPANDHLLFAYFGFSLRIRKRSLKTTLTARLAMKRRAAKHLLKSSGPILIRDATDTRYPFLDGDEKADRAKRGRWMVRRVNGLTHDAVRVVVRRHFAILEDDSTWDFAEVMNDAELSGYEDPWFDKGAEHQRQLARSEAMAIWDPFPEHKKAWLEVYARIPFDDILAIDQDGDEMFSHPQIYTAEWHDRNGPFKGALAHIYTIAPDKRELYPSADHAGRITVFARKADSACA